MASVDTLLKYLNSSNVAEFIDEDRQKSIVDSVINGYEIDDESRQNWLNSNIEAISLIKTTENDISSVQRNFPFVNSAKVVYNVIGPAVIQMSARLVQHLIRNGKVADCMVLGQDQVNPQTGLGIKEEKAKRVSDFLSYEKLVESDTWLEEQHKLCTIVSAWGTAFKEEYYDQVNKKVCVELLQPEDVIINNNIKCLDKAVRITVRLYMTKNEIIERIRAGQFLEIDLEKLDSNPVDNDTRENNSREEQPVFEILKQYCYIDLDDDDYAEPYCVFTTHSSNQLLGIYPAFDLEDLNINKKGQIISIKMRHGIIDYHLIDSPEGNFYSMGLNQLLLHPCKSATSILRQLVDAGTLANAASNSGFVNKGLKTKERSIKFKLGEFVPIDSPINGNIADQFYNLPFREPSQVLLALLQLIIENAKETGFISDILTGDAEMQNVPATTVLAMVEHSTRSFKPIVQKLQQSLKKEFVYWFYLYSKFLDKTTYFKFNDIDTQITKDDFDYGNLDIIPVADPTLSSEAQKYARLNALFQLFQTNAAGSINLQQALRLYFSELQFPNPQVLIAPPQPQQPDPRLVQAQVQAQANQMKFQTDQQELALKQQKVQDDKLKTAIMAHDKGISSQLKLHNTLNKSIKTTSDMKNDSINTAIQAQKVKVEAFNAETDRERLNTVEKQHPKPDTSK